VIGAAGTASCASGTRTLTLTTAAVGAGASIEVVGTTGGLPIGELGRTTGAIATGTDGDSVAAVLADLTAQLGGAGSFSPVGGAARLESNLVGASSQVTVGAGTTAALAAQLGLSAGQSDSGSDGDTVASIASARGDRGRHRVLQRGAGGAAALQEPDCDDGRADLGVDHRRVGGRAQRGHGGPGARRDGHPGRRARAGERAAGRVGALQNRLTAGQELALGAGTGFEAARSQIQDADYTQLSRDAVLEQTRTEAGIRALRMVHRLKQDAVASLLG